jgi:hypothetical protein
MWDLKSAFKFEQYNLALLKLNLKCHFQNDIDLIPKELTKDTTPNLDKLLLMKNDISSTKCEFFICKTYYISLKNNKISKLALANNLQISIILIVLALVKESFQ